ncbi:PREDICTED: uncharacterized protein LOC109209681 isoform X1 [Nicotiana attenuata]|uniref:Uncharacterized protein n=1 Tax=Nicotiana attenuata TaxID=49451 RepID=A0A314KN48_NICAT|nr:PREDICTED: uncharacterized protein LOC109209681 isoform X1 [Nicotiana attenuata]XP_019228543.1 PREDICTED: uncharacterized protein LOC109209681 isoform X1 [Nicotiana attenuata]XP_019228544.1 PREDICTED: uncharacterized protein LOC109209681 isoform X1 [Nicotiana attenuata]OIT30662.1 hypothetical protein A4A49_27817 [Nicotiana attenuata]
MDHIQSRESDLEIDLESGGTTSEEEGSNNRYLTEEASNKELYKAGSGFRGVQPSHGFARKQDGSNSYKKVLSADELSVRCTEIWSNKVREEMENSRDDKMDIERTRKPKPPKPPRPPKGPSLDAADIKFVKEISEIAIWKRRRTERIKALKKIKKESASPSKMNILATVITVLFFLIIIFQGTLVSWGMRNFDASALLRVFWALVCDSS